MTEAVEKKTFDLVVHRRDAKTGRVTSTNPYRLHVIDAVEYFERPKGSGNLWFRNNEAAGRLVNGKLAKDAEHVEWVKPLTEDEKLARDLASKDMELSSLKAELNDIKRAKKFAVKEEKGSPSKAWSDKDTGKGKDE